MAGSIVTILLFGVIVLLMLVVSAASGNLTGAGADGIFSWGMRSSVVFVYLFMGVWYMKLWNAFRDDDDNLIFDADGDGVEDDCKTHLLHCTICKTSACALVTMILLIVTYIAEPNAVWPALS